MQSHVCVGVCVCGYATQMNPPMNVHWALVYCAHVLEFSFDVISIFLPSVFIDATKMNRTEKRVQFKDAAVASEQQQQQHEEEEEEGEEPEKQLLIVVCHFWLGCFAASVLPLGLC